MIRATLFDLMGTLLIEDVDGPGDSFGNFHRVLQSAGLSMSPDELLECLSEIPSVAVSGPATPFEDRLLRVFAREGLSLTLSQLGEMAHEIQDYSNRILVLDPEAIQTLKAMRQFGPVGLVSNYDHPPNVHLLIERDGLGDSFDVVIISGEIGIWKPDPGILLAALEPMGITDPACVVYVGDSAVDVEAARAAKMPSVLIRREGGPSDPLREQQEEISIEADMVISRLSQLVEILPDLP